MFLKNTPHPSPSQLIEALGGPSVVSRLLTASGDEPVTPQAVSVWKTRGIPTNRIAQIALARGRVLRSISDIKPENWVVLFPELASVVEKNDS